MNDTTAAAGARFTLLSRLLHWSMAAMVITQLLLGVTMVASLSYYPLLLSIHRPLGLAILAFAVIRLLNRLTHSPPSFLATMSRLERRIASWSEYLMYALFVGATVGRLGDALGGATRIRISAAVAAACTSASAPTWHAVRSPWSPTSCTARFPTSPQPRNPRACCPLSCTESSGYPSHGRRLAE